MIQLETAYTVLFPVLAAGVGVAADSTPTAVLWRNGSASGVTVTVSTTATTGLYKATFTTLATGDGWAATDHLTLSVIATIAAVSDYLGVIWDSNGDVDVVMRGTNGAATLTNVSDAQTAIQDDIAAAQASIESDIADVQTGVDAIPGMINAINQSASRRIVLSTSTAFEVPDTGDVDYQIELRTFDGDGSPAAATGTPTLTATGGASGDLSSDLSAASNPATGIYRWTLTVAAAATVEQIWLDVSAVLSDGTFTTRTFSAIVDSVAVDFTSTDRTNLQTILANADVAISTRLASVSYTAPDNAGITAATTAATSAATAAGLAQTAAEAAQTSAATAATAATTASTTATAVNTKLGTPAGASVSADIATAQSGITQLLNRVTTTVATLWANLTAMITGSLDTAAWSETAMENAPAGAGGAGDASQETLLLVKAKTDLITPGTPIPVVSPVSENGTLRLVAGDHYTGANVLLLPVADPGEALKNAMEASDSVIFGAGSNGRANQVVGTIDKTALTHVSGVTTVPIAVTSDRPGEYEYHLKTVTGGLEKTRVSGCLIVSEERATPT